MVDRITEAADELDIIDALVAKVSGVAVEPKGALAAERIESLFHRYDGERDFRQAVGKVLQALLHHVRRIGQERVQIRPDAAAVNPLTTLGMIFVSAIVGCEAGAVPFPVPTTRNAEEE